MGGLASHVPEELLIVILQHVAENGDGRDLAAVAQVSRQFRRLANDSQVLRRIRFTEEGLEVALRRGPERIQQAAAIFTAVKENIKRMRVPRIVNAAASGGNVEALAALRAHGASAYALEAAAAAGQLRVIKWTLSHYRQDPLGKHLEKAVENGHLEAFKLLLDNAGFLTAHVSELAVRGRHWDIVHWLEANDRFAPSIGVAHHAAAAGRMDLVEKCLKGLAPFSLHLMGCSAMRGAISGQQTELVARLLSMKLSHLSDNIGSAASSGNVDIIKLFVAAGAKIDKHIVLLASSVPEHQAAFDFLLKHCNEPVPLYVSTRAMAEQLIERGSLVTDRSLKFAARYGDVELAAFLMERGARPTEDALHSAVCLDNCEMLSMLLEGDTQAVCRASAITAAAGAGKTQMLALLLHEAPAMNIVHYSFALERAARGSHVAAAEMLMAHGASADDTAIRAAAIAGCAPLLSRFLALRPTFASDVINHPRNPHHRHLMADVVEHDDNCCYQIVEILLRHGAAVSPGDVELARSANHAFVAELLEQHLAR